MFKKLPIESSELLLYKLYEKFHISVSEALIKFVRIAKIYKNPYKVKNQYKDHLHTKIVLY